MRDGVGCKTPDAACSAGSWAGSALYRHESGPRVGEGAASPAVEAQSPAHMEHFD